MLVFGFAALYVLFGVFDKFRVRFLHSRVSRCTSALVRLTVTTATPVTAVTKRIHTCVTILSVCVSWR